MLILKQVQDDISASPALGSLYDSDNSFLYCRSCLMCRRRIFSFTRLFRQTQRSRRRQVSRRSTQKSAARKSQRLCSFGPWSFDNCLCFYDVVFPSDYFTTCAGIYVFLAGCRQRAAGDVQIILINQENLLSLVFLYNS